MTPLSATASTQASQLLQSLSGLSQIVFCGRGAAGIAAALRARGLKDQWIVLPGNICYIAAWAVLASGNRPYLADVDPTTGNLSAATLDRIGLDDIGALIACHMYGLGAPMREIAAWAWKRDIFLIEDAALALGGQAEGRPAGGWGDVSIFSFGAGKIAGVGNGGAVATNDPVLADEIGKVLGVMPGWSPRLAELEDQWLQIYWALHQFEETNPKLPPLYGSLHQTFNEITAYQIEDYPYAELVEALEGLPLNLGHRRTIAGWYRQAMAGLPSTRGLTEPHGSVIWRYPLLIEEGKRDGLLKHLWAEGFHEVTRWYPALRHMLSNIVSGTCGEATPGADRLGAEIISLPVDGDIDTDTARWLAKTIRGYFDD